MGDFLRRQQSSCTFGKMLRETKLFWTSHMSRYFMESIRDNEDFKGAVGKIKKCQKGLNSKKKKYFAKETAVFMNFFQGERINLGCFGHLV